MRFRGPSAPEAPCPSGCSRSEHDRKLRAVKRIWPLVALPAMGCGGGDGLPPAVGPPPPVGPSPPVDPTAAELVGAWTGMGTFRQTIAGKTSTAMVRLNLSFDRRGVPSGVMSRFAVASASFRERTEDRAAVFPCG